MFNFAVSQVLFSCLKMTAEKIEEVKKIFEAYLESKGHRKTQERYIVLEEIYSRNDHFDVETLYFQIKAKYDRVSRATVYNTLELLEDCGLVIKHQFNLEKASQQALYEKSYGFRQHDHLICINCKQVMEFCDPRVAEIQKMIGELMQFEINHHSLVLYGSCKKVNCENKITNK